MHKQPLGQGLKCRSKISTSFAGLCARPILCKWQSFLFPMRKKTQNSREATVQNTPAKGSLLFIAPCNHSSHPLLLASLVFPTLCTPKYPYADCRQVDPYTMLGTSQGLCQHTIPVLPCSSKTQEKGTILYFMGLCTCPWLQGELLQRKAISQGQFAAVLFKSCSFLHPQVSADSSIHESNFYLVFS